MQHVRKPTPVEVISALISLNFQITDHNEQRLVLTNHRFSIPINRELFASSAEPILQRWLELIIAAQDSEFLAEQMGSNTALKHIKDWVDAPPAARLAG